jgi:hypothetical protein
VVSSRRSAGTCDPSAGLTGNASRQPTRPVRPRRHSPQPRNSRGRVSLERPPGGSVPSPTIPVTRPGSRLPSLGTKVGPVRGPTSPTPPMFDAQLGHNGQTCCPLSELRRPLRRDSSPGHRERGSQLSGVELALHLRTESDRDLGQDTAPCVGHCFRSRRIGTPDDPRRIPGAVQRNGSPATWTSRLCRGLDVDASLPPTKLLAFRRVIAGGNPAVPVARQRSHLPGR